MANNRTAVEWLDIQLLGVISFDSEHLREIYKNKIQKAKQIEQEKTINFANSFYDNCITEGGSLKQLAEEHYKETYG